MLKPEPSAERSLERRLRWPDGFVLSLTVPAGVMATLGYSIGALGAWAAAALWGICALIGIIQNYLFAEMAAMFPDKPGGITLYAQEAWRQYSRPAGAVAAWGYWMGWSMGMAVFGLLIGTLAQAQWFPDSTWTIWDGAVHIGLSHLIAAATIVAVWLLNVFGIKPAVRANYLIGALLVIVLAILIVVPFASGEFSASRLTWSLGADGQGWGGLRVALVWLFLMGWSGYATEIAGGPRGIADRHRRGTRRAGDRQRSPQLLRPRLRPPRRRSVGLRRAHSLRRVVSIYELQHGRRIAGAVRDGKRGHDDQAA
jgi:amino acid transporter